MTHLSEPRFLVLHGLRLKGFAEPEPLAEAGGLDLSRAVEVLAALEGEGLAQHRVGRISGWCLLPPGREAHAGALALDLSASGSGEILAQAYQAFVAVNADMLGVCTDWQMRPDGLTPLVNDHADPAYDAGVVDRLVAIDALIQPVCIKLASSMGRFARYGPRFSAALERVEAGDPEWFTKPLMDSYHT
ncbi:MAG: MarR family transcriptional regulator, partial [Acidimicrobiales bacterium]